AIQIGKLSGVKILVTASAGKHSLCKDLGADHAIDYHEGPFPDKVLKVTDDKGVDIIIDFIGSDYFLQNIECLKTDGRLILLATMSGGKVSDFDLRKILMKRIQVKGSTLRSRSLDYQIKLTKDFFAYADPLLKEKKLRPVIDTIFEWDKVVEAHHYMEANKNAGKIILKVV
ncbi:MAG: zinc-binding dehydrogenase, partial [Bacteroidota bacterium]|nr:zinc-binding dehydrogenase [Bacteroidota bacterium]